MRPNVFLLAGQKVLPGKEKKKKRKSRAIWQCLCFSWLMASSVCLSSPQSTATSGRAATSASPASPTCRWRARWRGGRGWSRWGSCPRPTPCSTATWASWSTRSGKKKLPPPSCYPTTDLEYELSPVLISISDSSLSRSVIPIKPKDIQSTTPHHTAYLVTVLELLIILRSWSLLWSCGCFQSTWSSKRHFLERDAAEKLTLWLRQYWTTLFLQRKVHVVALKVTQKTVRLQGFKLRPTVWWCD